MFAYTRFLAVAFAGLGIVLSFYLTSSPAWGKDLFSTLRSIKVQTVKTDEEASGGSAQSLHSHARTYADNKDGNKANTYYGHALKNATPQQTPAIAADYAAHLMETGDLRKAELILKQALTQSPDDEKLARMLARCLVRQEKMIEGLRYFQMVGTEAEAKAEIAAIYREQGNTGMLAAVERKWGTTATARPEVSPDVRPEPVLVAVRPTPSPSSSPVLSPPVLPAKTTAPPVPTLVARSTPPPTAVVPAPTEQTVSKSTLSSAKIPIPVPNASPQPMTTLAIAPKPALSMPTSKVVAPLPPPVRRASENSETANFAPVTLPTTPTSVLAQSETKVPARPATGVKPRKHYVVESGTSADLDALFPIKPVTAMMPVRR